MELKNYDEQFLTRYLLGEVSDAERAQVEERFFADDDYYQSLLVAEDELIYNYLCGALSPHQRGLFAAQLAASPKRRDKMKFVKDLMTAAAANTAAVTVAARVPAIVTPRDESAATPRSDDERKSFWQSLLAFLSGRNAALQFGMAAALLLIALGGVWMWRQSRTLSAELEAAKAHQHQYEQSVRDAEARATIEQQKADQLRQQNAALNDELKRQQQVRAELEKANEQLIAQAENPAKPTGLTIPFTLEPGLPRSDSEAPRRLYLPRRAAQLKLTLALGSDDGGGKYRAEFSTRGGNLIWRQDGLSSRPRAWGKALVVNLPVRVLRNSEYDLTVKRVISKGAFEDVGSYYLKIVKQ
ncbi:MAG: hypothetical protein HY231_05100 [Acidobacteria bacterium]|nr:hypothetical protein [Acidobacteriota bacterium]